MLRKQLEHVIQKRQPGADARLAVTIEVKPHTNVGLFRLALDLRDSRRVLRQAVFAFVHRPSPHGLLQENDATVALDSSFSLSLWERVGERAYGSLPSATPSSPALLPKGEGRCNQSHFGKSSCSDNTSSPRSKYLS